jgi:hypothetical protein
MPRIKTNKNNPSTSNDAIEELFENLNIKELWQCRFPDCCQIAAFGDKEGENLFCNIHKDEGHIPTIKLDQFYKLPGYEKKIGKRGFILKNICLFTTCNKRPSYNFKDNKYIERHIVCKEHILPGMDDIDSPRCIKCIELNIKKPVIASYGKKGGPKLYCEKHKIDGTINIRTKKCIICKEEYAYYNEPELPPLYCKKCRKPGMKAINNKCIVCKKVSRNFNYKGCSCWTLKHQKPIKSPNKCYIFFL